jgi:hypothetical protein
MKMLIAQVVAAVALALSLPAAAAECTYPRAPDTMPDGNTASLDEMKAAKKDYDAYNSAMSVYLDCLKADYEASLPKIEDSMSDAKKKEIQKQRDDSEKRFTAKYDSAVDEVHSVMDRFNEQIRSFNAKRKAAKEKSG